MTPHQRSNLAVASWTEMKRTRTNAHHRTIRRQIERIHQNQTPATRTTEKKNPPQRRHRFHSRCCCFCYYRYSLRCLRRPRAPSPSRPPPSPSLHPVPFFYAVSVSREDIARHGRPVLFPGASFEPALHPPSGSICRPSAASRSPPRVVPPGFEGSQGEGRNAMSRRRERERDSLARKATSFVGRRIRSRGSIHIGPCRVH